MRARIAAMFVIALLSFGVLSATADSELNPVVVPTTSTTTTTQAGPTQEEIDILLTQIWNNQVWINKTNEKIWIANTNENIRLEQERQAQEAQVEAKVQAAAQAEAPTSRRQAPIAEEQGNGRCGGDLPPCWVMNRESGGNIRAQNPTSTASGKWQFLDSTWGGYGGYASAYLAPESVQDAKARALWAGGAGCSHWSAC